MIRYNCNQKEFEDTQSQQSLSKQSEQSSNLKSTADNSVITAHKESLSTNWFKQIINYKNAILGKTEAKNQAGYLPTIESEEIMGTEGCQTDTISNNPNSMSVLKRIEGPSGTSSSINNRSSILSQSHYEECGSRKSAEAYYKGNSVSR